MRVGVFDSGLGGLTIAKAILENTTGLELIYLADTANTPYGDKSSELILQFSVDITNYLIKTYDIKVLIVACNTATSAAIERLRQLYPQLIIIGTEPAINPAFSMSKSKHIGVLATFATLNGQKYRDLVNKLSQNNNTVVYEQPCVGLVEQIELGEIDSVKTMQLLENYLAPMRENGVDTVVLGCTHYPLIKDSIKKIFDREIEFSDSSSGVTNRLKALLMQNNIHTKDTPSTIEILTTDIIDKNMIKNIIGENLNIKMVQLDNNKSGKI